MSSKNKGKNKLSTEETKVGDSTDVVESPIVSTDSVNVDTTETIEPVESVVESTVTDESVTETDPVVTEETVSQPLEPVIDTSPVTATNHFTVLPDDSFIVALVKERLVSYVRIMDIKANSTAYERINAQRTLKSVVDAILKTDGSDFGFGLDALLNIINNEEVIFDARYLFRNWDAMGWNNVEKENLENSLHLFTTIADPRTRRNYAQQIDVRKALKGYMHNETLMQLLMEYLAR